MRSFGRRAALALVLSLEFAPLLSAARIEGPPDREIGDRVHRHFLVEQMRIAASGRLIEADDEIAAYLNAGFNTIVLYDTEEGLLKSEQRIAFEVGFARAHGLHIVLGKATEPVAPELSGKRQRMRRAFASAGTAAVSDEEIRDRLDLWDRYGHDLIVGVFFLHDDAFFIHAGVERQLHLYSLAKETVPEWSVFGMIGEYGFDASPEEVDRYFDPNAFDHLIIMMFPLNVGEVTGVKLDVVTSADPDADMREYVQRYAARMGEKFISRLQRGQLAVLLIQAFAYNGEPAGHVPRPADIEIQATAGSELVRKIAGQDRNRAVAYFLWDGAPGGMFGLWQRADWRAAAEEANRAQDEENRQINP